MSYSFYPSQFNELSTFIDTKKYPRELRLTHGVEGREHTLMMNTVNVLVEPLSVQNAVTPVEDEILQDEVR